MGGETIDPSATRNSTTRSAIFATPSSGTAIVTRSAFCRKTGQVAIFNDGKYDYSLGPDDFKDMFLDGIEQSKTVHYEIVDSRTKGDEVHLRARHEYTDSFGSDQTVLPHLHAPT